MKVESLADDIEIENLLSRYCRAVDSKDWNLYRTLLTDDAHLDYSAAGLFVGGPDDAVAYLTRHQESITVGMHYVTNIEVTNIEVTNIESRVAGDHAEVVAMWFNAVRLPGGDDMSFFHGRWHDEMIKTDTGWRIQKLRLEVVG